jgi:hypothetical protein
MVPVVEGRIKRREKRRSKGERRKCSVVTLKCEKRVERIS